MCEHNTTIVKYDQGNVQVEVCTWGCGQTLIGVKDVTGLTRTFTIAELSALRERVEALEGICRKVINGEWCDNDGRGCGASNYVGYNMGICPVCVSAGDMKLIDGECPRCGLDWKFLQAP